MDFKILYQKYLANECTPEEKAFVESEIERAKMVSEELFNEHMRVEFKPCCDQDAMLARKKFNKINFIKTLAISVLSCILVGVLTLALIYGISVSSAKNNMKYTAQQGEQAVREHIYNHMVTNYALQNLGIDTIYVKEDDRDLEIKGPLNKSYYLIEYEIKLPGYEAEAEMNSRTGEIVITDVERD